MITARYNHSAVKLADGRVFVAGGLGIHQNPLIEAEIYNPINNSWTAVPNMPNIQGATAAVLLPNGQVVVVGPYSSNF